MYKEIKRCRICGNENIVPVLNLGEQYLTGVFPKHKDEKITCGPLELVKCHDNEDDASCGLLQLKHSYDLNDLYGNNYGYRSGLNQSMVEHLHRKVKNICRLADPQGGDLIIDIGSNDGTLLQGYPGTNLKRVGIDPTAIKYKDYYSPSIEIIPDFFTSGVIAEKFNSQKAKIITSIAMFYDLESPMDFMQQIYDTLDDNGIWVFEQSYMPAMLEMTAYDTICHEHLEYYGLRQIKWMTDQIGFKIIGIELNDVNGGSFSVTVSKREAGYKEDASKIHTVLSKEKQMGLDGFAPLQDFNQRVVKHRNDLNEFIQSIRAENKTILGYGASTKGNVILQYCHITKSDIPFIAEVNADKFGCYTPGTLIPIVSEADARAMKPDYFMVLPWHFRENIVAREADYLSKGGRLFFPLPGLAVVQN